MRHLWLKTSFLLILVVIALCCPPHSKSDDETIRYACVIVGDPDAEESLGLGGNERTIGVFPTYEEAQQAGAAWSKAHPKNYSLPNVRRVRTKQINPPKRRPPQSEDPTLRNGRKPGFNTNTGQPQLPENVLSERQKKAFDAFNERTRLTTEEEGLARQKKSLDSDWKKLRSQRNTIADKALEAQTATGARREALEKEIASLKEGYNRSLKDYKTAFSDYKDRTNTFKDGVDKLKVTEGQLGIQYARKESPTSDSMARWREKRPSESRSSAYRQNPANDDSTARWRQSQPSRPGAAEPAKDSQSSGELKRQLIGTAWGGRGLFSNGGGGRVSVWFDGEDQGRVIWGVAQNTVMQMTWRTSGDSIIVTVQWSNGETGTMTLRMQGEVLTGTSAGKGFTVDYTLRKGRNLDKTID
jgi:hypothetical protein